jgi:hypothetical protein
MEGRNGDGHAMCNWLGSWHAYLYLRLVALPVGTMLVGRTSAGSERDGVCRLAIVSHVLEGGVDLPTMPWWEVGRSTVLGANKEWYDLNPPFRTIEPKFHRTLSMLHMLEGRLCPTGCRPCMGTPYEMVTGTGADQVPDRYIRAPRYPTPTFHIRS